MLVNHTAAVDNNDTQKREANHRNQQTVKQIPVCLQILHCIFTCQKQVNNFPEKYGIVSCRTLYNTVPIMPIRYSARFPSMFSHSHWILVFGNGFVLLFIFHIPPYLLKIKRFLHFSLSNAFAIVSIFISL